MKDFYCSVTMLKELGLNIFSFADSQAVSQCDLSASFTQNSVKTWWTSNKNMHIIVILLELVLDCIVLYSTICLASSTNLINSPLYA